MNLPTWTTEEIVRYANIEAKTDLERELLVRLVETLDTLDETEINRQHAVDKYEEAIDRAVAAEEALDLYI